MLSALFRRKLPPLPAPKVDLHSHLIPGIDDGSQSLEESLALLRQMEGLGYTKVITTPHIMIDAYRNTPKIIHQGLAHLRTAAQEAGITLTIDAAAEYYLDEGFASHLKSEDLLTICGRYLLFETSYTSRPLQLEETIFEILAAGYTPILAHPERYRYITDPTTQFSYLKELGVLFQVNLNSLTGHYGKSAQTHAHHLVRAGQIDFLGTDTHRIKHLETLPGVFASSIYREIFKSNTILNDTLV